MKYQELLEECQNIYTELSFNSRWVRISMFHLIGKLVLQEDLSPDKMSSFARQVGIKPVDLALAILLAEKYPDLDDLPADKTISWSQIGKYLNAQDETES